MIAVTLQTVLSQWIFKFSFLPFSFSCGNNKERGRRYFYINTNLKLGSLMRTSLGLSAVESAVHGYVRHAFYYTKTR